MEVKRVMVVGAGQMGSGIAQVLAEAGYSVILHDINEEAVNKGMANIYHHLTKQVAKGKRQEEEKTTIIDRIERSTTLENAATCDLIIEAAIENLDVKKAIFKELDRLAPPEAILATNTSSLPITEIASVTNRPEKVIGMHFMNPVPIMRLVEVIRGLATNEETYETIFTITEKLNKVPVEVNDFPGFVSNRILIPMINEAIFALYEGVATKEAIDEIMKLGMNHPMGPLTLADMIGLDTCLFIMETLHEGLGDAKYRPCPLLRKYVSAGWLGRKTGRGFYVYK